MELSEEEKITIEKISNGKKIDLISLIRKFKKEGIENFVVTRPKYIHTLSNLILKHQKEIEELKSDNYELNCRINDLLESVPKSKIEDKIKENVLGKKFILLNEEEIKELLGDE